MRGRHFVDLERNTAKWGSCKETSTGGGGRQSSVGLFSLDCKHDKVQYHTGTHSMGIEATNERNVNAADVILDGSRELQCAA